jgi:hypothetical protein
MRFVEDKQGPALALGRLCQARIHPIAGFRAHAHRTNLCDCRSTLKRTDLLSTTDEVIE